MKDAVEQLARARYIASQRKVALADAEAELFASVEWQRTEEKREDLRVARADAAIAETEVREQAVGIYVGTGDKLPHPAVPIKMFTVLEYKELNALDYAREHLPKAVKLIKRKFEQAAKVLGLDFVTITQEPRATIARDLSEYLPEN